MKKATIWGIVLFAMTGCGGCNQSYTQGDDLVTVDVTVTYPKKELILQNFMDVEYIPLETNDDFICQGSVQAIGKKLLLVINRVEDGNIYFFDRTGKGLKKINRLGQGGEEYTTILGIVLDEEAGEMFVNDHFTKRILVYDLDGKYKRTIKHKEGFMYDRVLNFDQGNLICHNGSFANEEKSKEPSLLVISKQDGSITKEIQIPFEKKKVTWMIVTNQASNMTYASAPSTECPIIPGFGNQILVEPSADTVYKYAPDHTMTPLLVRIPSVQSMDPEIFLFLSILTDRYYFMEAVKKTYDFETQEGFPGTDLLYDREEKTIFQYSVYNDDYSNKKEVYMKSTPVNDEIATWQPMSADKLIEANEKGELKGRLKEIASNLDEESNPVIMLMKYKGKK